MSRKMSLSLGVAVLLAGMVLVLTSASTVRPASPSRLGWSDEERGVLESLSLSSLDALPPDASNRFANDPAAAELGSKLFFETKLSANGQVSCASCHVPDKGFQDARPLGVGVDTGGRRTMPVAGTAYSPWQFWDGRRDSQWSQALGPLESAVEHGGDRVQYAHVMAAQYGDEYRAVFGPLPDLGGLPDRAGPVADTLRSQAWNRIVPVRQTEISRVYANIGKAIAAYERGITFTPSRFDRYVDAELANRVHTPDDAFSIDERAGLRLFIGKASCSTCHNGSLLTDNHFHNTGVPATPASANDSGRTAGVRQAEEAEFNCSSKYSDAKAEDCAELRFAVTEGPELVRAFKTPSLRNAATRAPYMHAGQFATLGEVLAHYNRAPAAPMGKSELKPLRLSDKELTQIAAFLQTLVSPLNVPVRHQQR